MGYHNRDGNGEFQTGFMIPQVNYNYNLTISGQILGHNKKRKSL